MKKETRQDSCYGKEKQVPRVSLDRRDSFLGVRAWNSSKLGPNTPTRLTLIPRIHHREL